MMRPSGRIATPRASEELGPTAVITIPSPPPNDGSGTPPAVLADDHDAGVGAVVPAANDHDLPVGLDSNVKGLVVGA